MQAYQERQEYIVRQRAKVEVENVGMNRMC